MDQNFKKKAARGIMRCVHRRVTQDPNDKSGYPLDSTELIHYMSKRVTHAEIWECPLERLGDFLQCLGIVHQGIVVTMESGDMLLVHKLPNKEEEGKGDVVVTYKSSMGENWSFVQGKDVNSATLNDYMEKCGLGYNKITDNCLDAVARMWSVKRSDSSMDQNRAFDSINTTEMFYYMSKRVTRAEIWKCPLENLANFLQLFGIFHQGIVVKMESGEMLLVHKLPQVNKTRKGDVIVTYKSNMGENWSFVQGKDVNSAKLSDYLEKCGPGFHMTTDNCLHAVKRMWSLN